MIADRNVSFLLGDDMMAFLKDEFDDSEKLKKISLDRKK